MAPDHADTVETSQGLHVRPSFTPHACQGTTSTQIEKVGRKKRKTGSIIERIRGDGGDAEGGETDQVAEREANREGGENAGENERPEQCDSDRRMRKENC